MKILAIIAALHVGASNHAVGIEWCTCASQPVPVRLPDWRAVQPVPTVRVPTWQVRAVRSPLPIRHR